MLTILLKQLRAEDVSVESTNHRLNSPGSVVSLSEQPVLVQHLLSDVVLTLTDDLPQPRLQQNYCVVERKVFCSSEMSSECPLPEQKQYQFRYSLCLAQKQTDAIGRESCREKSG